MTGLTLAQADAIADTALAQGIDRTFAPLSVVVLDAGGVILVAKRHEAASPYRVDIARGKAGGCVGMGMGGRAIAARAGKAPGFYQALGALVPVVPVPGGVLIRDADGRLLGAVGISGDTADNDEACALAGIAAAGLHAQTGETPSPAPTEPS